MESQHEPAKMQHFFLDESAYYFGKTDDALKEKLRSMEAVPDAAYVVDEGTVFVFARLIELVREASPSPDPVNLPNLAEIVATVLPRAWITAREAVERWKVVPHLYERRGDLIVHTEFGAAVPGSYPTWDGAAVGYERLLLGDVIAGTGDFVHRGQPLNLLEPLDEALLPPRPWEPSLDGPGPDSTLVRGQTINLNDEATTFAFLPAGLARRVMHLDKAWQMDQALVAAAERAYSETLCANMGSYGFESITNEDGQPFGAADDDEHFRDSMPVLRTTFPQLAALSDEALYGLYDRFYRDTFLDEDWAVDLLGGFPTYLLGKAVDSGYHGRDAGRVGAWVAYGLSQAMTYPDAKERAKLAEKYDTALSAMTRRVNRIISFVTWESESAGQRGPAITTWMDTMRVFRKKAVVLTPSHQTVADLLANDPTTAAAVIANAKIKLHLKSE